jgi:hypothetical protein
MNWRRTTMTVGTTTILPPTTAVKIAWALTGNFSKEESKDIATEATKSLHDAIEDAKISKNEAEINYVKNAADEIQATMRTLDTIYKGRELNLTENDQLRQITLNNIEKDVTFGQSAQDIVKSLPSMAIATGVGTISLNQLVEAFNWPGWSLWLIGLFSAGVGYLIKSAITNAGLKKKQLIYIHQDCERTIYYEQYISRVKTTLLNLYFDIDRLHKRYFEQKYPLGEKEDADSVVRGMLAGAMSTLCPYALKHLNQGIINPDIWTKCETGVKSSEECIYWGK